MSSFKRTLTMFIVGVLIFAGLPLIAWGVADLQGFIANPARLAYILVVIALQLVLVIKFPRMGQQTRAEGNQTVQRQRIAVLLLQLFSIAIILAAPISDRRTILPLTSADLIRYLGLILFVAGMIAVNWAEDSLGKQFSVQVTLQKDHQLVTDGLYRWVRNPRYLGIITFNLGLALTFNALVALILVLGLTVVLLWRIGDEEAFMHQAFGAAWEAYAKTSWHLIPYVY